MSWHSQLISTYFNKFSKGKFSKRNFRKEKFRFSKHFRKELMKLTLEKWHQLIFLIELNELVDKK